MVDFVSRREVIAATGAGIVGGTAGCLDLVGGGTSTVAVGGKQFTEQLLLSWISTHLLRDAGYEVDDKFPIGGNTANHKAITNARVDHYWEYTGTGWNYHLGHESEERIGDRQDQYEKVSQEYEDEHDIVWLDMAPFNNTYIVTANPQWQEETGVKTMSKLSEYINDGGEVTWAVSQEYLDNPTAFGNLPEFYEFEDSVENVTWEKMAIGTINYKAVANGQVDLGVGFATNPNIQKFGLATVEDDRNWFTIYYPAPLVRQEVLDDGIRKALNKPTDKLTTEQMRALNAKVSIDEKDPSTVAENWLEDEGLL